MASLQEARRDRNEAVARMVEEEDESAWTYEQQNRQKREGGTGGNILESAMEKTGELKDKAKRGVDETKDKAREMTDSARDKTGENKDVTERSSEKEKGINREKLEEYKESAAEAARKAREYLTDIKEEMRLKFTAETKERLGGTEESARKDLEEVKRRAAEMAMEAHHKKLVEPDEQEKSARENIYGSFPNLTESIKEKMTMPNEIVEHKRGVLSSHEVRDGDGSRERVERESGEEDDPMLRVKDADQMTGTWFIDVGKMGGEGTGFTTKKK